jgi:alkanesulfonate monooxygenase SsuD/methylene tetrahydromethanopterin reductase-like flavin-dependent oxidoreductase (luciferase family)
MEFGTFLLLQTPSADPSDVVYRRGVEITQAAEELGFRNMWLAEHHFSTYGLLSRPLTYAQHLADKTRTIRVGTAVIVVPLHHPLTIAEEIATVDLLSGGRLDVGLGRGYQRYEFERFGCDLGESRQRWEEAVDVVMLALSGKTFSYDGKYYRIPETTIFPQPVQKPHPPMWVTAQSPDSIVTTARRGFNLLTGGYGVSLGRLREFRAAFEQALAEYRPSQAPRVGVQRPVYVAQSDAEARAVVEQARWNMRVTLSLRNNYERVENGHAMPIPAPSEPSIEDFLDNFSVIGTPDTCIRQIGKLQDAMHIDHFNCSFSFGDLPQAEILTSMRRFAADVLPAFK